MINPRSIINSHPILIEKLKRDQKNMMINIVAKKNNY